MAVNINVPSQVKTYANLAAFPATGALKTIYIAEDTNKTYRWTGSVYTEISASAAMTWGAIGGTLSNQTDLNTALNAKVPTSRTLTINGVTQDLSADRTFTIATGLTVGTTPIASGTIGRVLFQGAGNVVQQSSSLFWDDTNAYLNLGATGTFNTARIIFNQPRLSAINGIVWADNVAFPHGFIALDRSSGEFRWSPNSGGYFPTIYSNGSEAMRIATTRNVLIGTTTDAGFRLDVNGTARVQSLQILSTGNFGNSIIRTSASGIAEQIYNSGGTTYLGADSSAGGFLFTGGLPYASFFGNGANYPTQFGTNGTTRMTIFAGGNVGINTTTDAGFRLDVNGTARVQGDLTIAKNQNAPTRADIINTTSGTSAYTEYRVSPNSASSSTASFGKYSSTTTAFKFVSANDAYIFNGNSGDIAILNDNLTGRIKFGAGGASTAQMTLKASGVLNLSSVPTSPAGLSSGDVWNNLGVLMIV